MNSLHSPLTFELVPADTSRLAHLCGQFDTNLKQIERFLEVRIKSRGNLFRVEGDRSNIERARNVITRLYEDTAKRINLVPEHIHMTMTDVNGLAETAPESAGEETAVDQFEVMLKTGKARVAGKTPRQREYLRQIAANDISFGIGPAGTGKTFLAVASASSALINDEVNRIVLVRPAVEAGERLGFLPGDIGQKVDPYLRPLYDALYEMLGFEKVGRLLDRGIIELAPLAYMRGRTLNDAFVILDEAQNTTEEQMKMFLTRIGFGSKAVITGDVTQIDLPRGVRSGLKHASEILRGIDGITITRFTARDVVRHPLVQRIVEAYESGDNGDDDGR